jgi:hypothetical protein
VPYRIWSYPSPLPSWYLDSNQTIKPIHTPQLKWRPHTFTEMATVEMKVKWMLAVNLKLAIQVINIPIDTSKLRKARMIIRETRYTHIHKRKTNTTCFIILSNSILKPKLQKK